MSAEEVRAELMGIVGQLQGVSGQLVDLTGELERCMGTVQRALAGSSSPAVESVAMIGSSVERVEQAQYAVDAAWGALEGYLPTL